MSSDLSIIASCVSLQFLMLVSAYCKNKKKSPRKYWMRKIFHKRNSLGFNPALISELRDHDHQYYKDFMRMTPEIFDRLLHRLGPVTAKKNTRWRDSISAKDRLAITLRFLATGETHRSLSFAFRIGRSTTSAIVRETCEAIWMELKETYLAFPRSHNEWLTIARGFQMSWQLPHCCGSIDGKHVIMECPYKTGSLNFNYKGTFSKVLLAVVDDRYRFIAVDFGSFGGESDGGIFAKSTFGTLLDQKKLELPSATTLPNSNLKFPYFFVVDAAFPLKENLLRPYPRKSALTHQKRIYNYRLSRARRIVENAFGILAARFRIFKRPLRYSEESINYMVMATLVLHNFLMTECSSYCPRGYADVDDSEHQHTPGQWRHECDETQGLINGFRFGSNTYCNQAKNLRDQLANYLSNEGAVHWQNAVVYQHQH